MIKNLRAVYVFAKAVDIGSFRGAAKALGLSPSVVSYHISQLEQDLETALLYRSTRKLSLTSQGKTLYSAVKDMIDAADAGFINLAGKESLQSGKLTISAPAALSRGLMIDDIAKFATQFPKVELSITFTDKRENLIDRGIDIAIRVGDLPDSNLKSRKITDISRKLVASPRYMARVQEPDSPVDLEKLKWIRFDATPPKRIFTHSRLGKETVRIESNITVDSIDALCQFAKAGLGLGTPPAFLVEKELQIGELVEVLPAWKLDRLDVFAVWPSNTPRESLTNRFVEMLVDDGTVTRQRMDTRFVQESG